MKNKLSSLAFLVIILMSLASCKNIKEPVFKKIDNVKIDHIGSGDALVLLDITYYNPNQSKLSIKHAEGDAWLEDKLLGHFLLDTLIRIPPRAEFILPVSLKVEMASMVQHSINLLLKPEVLVRIEGNAKVGKSGFYMRYPIKYEGKQNLAGLIK